MLGVEAILLKSRGQKSDNWIVYTPFRDISVDENGGNWRNHGTGPCVIFHHHRGLGNGLCLTHERNRYVYGQRSSLYRISQIETEMSLRRERWGVERCLGGLGQFTKGF